MSTRVAVVGAAAGAMVALQGCARVDTFGTTTSTMAPTIVPESTSTQTPTHTLPSPDHRISCNQVDGDYPGCGVSKSTYSATDPVAGKRWMTKYFPVQTPSDECTDDVCECSATSNHAAWEIQQGRVYATRKISASGGGSAGNGFGMHLVNVSAHLTTGGLSTAEVERYYNSKLGDMTKFDSFMDFNVAFATSDLQGYKDTFNADGVKYLAGTWTDADGSDYSSIFVQVPSSQLILELVQSGSLTYAKDEAQPMKLEQRVPSATLFAQKTKLSRKYGVSATSGVGSNIVSLAVNRAISSTALAKLEDFYVTGMGTTMTHDATEGDVTKKCFLWPGASVNICFTNRPDSATSGQWKVQDFENMLNTVHSNIIGGYPLCGMDKWEDNHYAIDSHTADTSAILSYVNENNPYHICTAGMGGSTSLHYIFDPTGWGIQVDLGISAPNDCLSAGLKGEASGSHSNPACDLDTSTCSSGLFTSKSVIV